MKHFEDKSELLKYTGSMQQLAYVRPLVFSEGRSTGMRAFSVKNDGLAFTVLTDKCLDVAELSYKGVNFSFLSKPGLQGRNMYDTNGDEAIYSIMGGFFFTAGLSNICPPCTVDGVDYPMHGRIRTTPAEHSSGKAFWKDDQYVLQISGEMREASLFGGNLVLRRTIESVLGEKSFIVTDEIENETHNALPLMLLYHINVGYPLLDQETEILMPSNQVTARDDFSKDHLNQWNRMDAPKPNEGEYVFIHQAVPNSDGMVTVCAYNHKLEMGLRLDYTAKHLPNFMQWKSTAYGDYVIGLEPTNSSPFGRAHDKEKGILNYLAAFEREKNILKFSIIEGKQEFAEVRDEINVTQSRFSGKQY